VFPVPKNGEFFSIYSTGVEQDGVYLPIISTCRLPTQIAKVCNEKGQPVVNVNTPFNFNGDLSFYPNTVFNLNSNVVINGAVDLGTNPTVHVSSNVNVYGGMSYSGGNFFLDKGGYFLVNSFFMQKGQSSFYTSPGSSSKLNGTWSVMDSNLIVSKKANFEVTGDLTLENSALVIGISSNVQANCLKVTNSKLVIDISQLDLTDSLEKNPTKKIISYKCTEGRFTSVTANKGADICIEVLDPTYNNDGLYVTFKILSKSSTCTSAQISPARTILPYFISFILGLALFI
jgi:hypothetical protein